MVYCGKPSKNCGLCRKRRIRCDRRPAGCSQCKTFGRECPGYRSEIDLMFRDESDKVSRKCRKDSPPGEDVSRRKSKITSRAGISEEVVDDDSLSLQKLTIIPMSESVCDPAVSFFLSTYIRESQYEYLATLHSSRPCSFVLTPGIEAAALASLSQEMGRLDLLTVARKRYMTALKSLNSQLSDEQNCNDQTLAAIMTLALFETIVRTDDEASKSFGKHVNGALALLSCRPLSMFQSEVPDKLFRQIRISVQLDCIQRQSRVPVQLRALMKQPEFFAKQSQVQILLSCFVNDFIEFRAALAEGDLHDPLEIIHEARDLDEKWRELIMADLRSWNSYDIVETDRDDSTLFENTYHVYQDHPSAQSWNSLRMMSLMLNEVMYRAAWDMKQQNLDTADAAAGLDLAQVMLDAAASVRETASQICHSVPQYLRQQETGKTRAPGRIASGYFFMWPLFTAGNSALVSQSLRQYAIDRLKDIASTCKILQAENAAEALEDRVDDDEDWIHMSYVF